MSDVRKIAYETLRRVLREDAYSALALNAAVKKYALSPLDTSFLSALVYGVLERMLTLDHVLQQYSDIPLKKIDSATLLVLRLGIYQLLFMDKVPDCAAVDESVKLAKKLKLFRSAGFINAVLRNFIRRQKAYRLPDEKSVTEYLSVLYSCPENIVGIFLSAYGKDNTVRILQELSGRPKLFIRVNTLKTTKDALRSALTSRGIKTEEVLFLENALSVSDTGSIEMIPEFQDGLFYVQDAASQLACEILGAEPRETVCDVCAAPGGKSLYSAIRMNNSGQVYAYDIFEHKLGLIRSSADRLGVKIINASLRDAEKADELLPPCNRILCDVPCSGLGILRRKPEIRYKKDTNIDILPQLQYSILCRNTYSIPRGGVVVYSTCTLDPKENRKITDLFLEEHPDFEPYPLELPKGFDRFIDEPEHMLTILPFRYDTDGFFVARFRKAGG